jgi:hypothetical protein
MTTESHRVLVGADLDYDLLVQERFASREVRDPVQWCRLRSGWDSAMSCTSRQAVRPTEQVELDLQNDCHQRRRRRQRRI